MKKTIFSFLALTFVTSASFADCGYSFGESAEDVQLCAAINLSSVQEFFNIGETPYTNPATVESFEIKSVAERSSEEVGLKMDLLYSVVYIDSWEPGQEPSLELDSCTVYLQKDYDDPAVWYFSYASCENFGEFDAE